MSKPRIQPLPLRTDSRTGAPRSQFGTVPGDAVPGGPVLDVPPLPAFDEADETTRLYRVALDPGSSEEARLALLGTARQSIRFRHPSVLAVRTVRLEGSQLVFVQDSPPGVALMEVLARQGPVSAPEALGWMSRFAQAMESVQAAGLTLSRISPQEFMVHGAGAAGSESTLICLSPPVPAGWWLEVENPAFASPEQLAGKPCDQRSALFSAGAVLAFMLSRSQPGKGETWKQFVGVCRLPMAVDAALKAVLEPEAEKRCQSAADWALMLEQARVAKAPPPVERQPVRPFLPPQPEPVPAPDRPVLPLLLFFVSLAVLFAGLGWFVFSGNVALRPGADAQVEVHPLQVERPAPPPPALPPPTHVPPLPLVAEVPEPPAPVAIPAPEPQPPAPSPPPVAVAEAASPPAPPQDSEEALVAKARDAAPGAARADLFQLVLERFPENKEALRGLVSEAMLSFPGEPARRQKLSGQARKLAEAGDPLGTQALGCLALHKADESTDLTTATRSLIEAVDDFQEALKKGHAAAGVFLLQSYVKLHNVQQEDEDPRQAELTRRALMDAIDRLPAAVPAQDLRKLAEQLQGQVDQGAAKGRPHPQAAFLHKVAQRLLTAVAERDKN